MRALTLILFFIFSLGSYLNSQIIIPDNGIIDCEELNNLLTDNADNAIDIICFIKETPSIFETIVTLNGNGCDNIIVGAGKELRIPSNVTILLEDGTSITLEEDGRISGEHFGTSRIEVDRAFDANGELINQPALNLDNCVGCSVSSITLASNRDNPNDPDNPFPPSGTGMTIDEDSSDNEVSSVRFRDLNDGIILDGSGNIFNDLDFFRAGIGDSNCDADDNEFAAIRMNSSSDNEFTNILHTRSLAAVTFWFSGECHNNSILNVSVEQEDSPCHSVLNGEDPAIYFENLLCTGNFISTNLNHARVAIVGDDIVINNEDDQAIVDGLRNTICNNNTISSFGQNCNGAATCGSN